MPQSCVASTRYGAPTSALSRVRRCVKRSDGAMIARSRGIPRGSLRSQPRRSSSAIVAKIEISVLVATVRQMLDFQQIEHSWAVNRSAADATRDKLIVGLGPGHAGHATRAYRERPIAPAASANRPFDLLSGQPEGSLPAALFGSVEHSSYRDLLRKFRTVVDRPDASSLGRLEIGNHMATTPTPIAAHFAICPLGWKPLHTASAGEHLIRLVRHRRCRPAEHETHRVSSRGAPGQSLSSGRPKAGPGGRGRLGVVAISSSRSREGRDCFVAPLLERNESPIMRSEG
jgi:hypothetical protein